MFNNKSATALLGVDAPLGSLNARIAACHALGLISDIEKHDLTILRKIRNEFAHHIEASFDLPKIRDLCRSLCMKAPEHVTEVMGKTGEFESSAIITTLANRPHYVGLQRRKVQDWPH
jgi:mannitol operon repressor